MSKIAGLEVPKYNDGKQVVQVTPRRDGLHTWFHGAGDQLSPIKRAGGTTLCLTLSGSGASGSTEIYYSEAMWLHDGGVLWNKTDLWGVEDSYSLFLRMPATVVSASSPPNTGNCIIISGSIIPYVSGTHVVDTSTAVPIPVSDENNPNGYWAVDPDDDVGIPTVSATPGTDEYHLLTSEIKLYMMKNMPIFGPRGMFDVDAYELKYIHPTWFVGIEAEKISSGSASIRGWLLGYRSTITEG